MTSDGVLIVRNLFENIWKLFTSWTIPGTFVTPLAWGLMATFVGLTIRFISRVTMSYDSSDVPLSKHTFNTPHYKGTLKYWKRY